MAAPTQTKRSAASPEQSTTKRAKVAVHVRAARVASALLDDKLMPSAISKLSLKMLASGVPLALQAAAEERHEAQSMVASHVQEVFGEATEALAAGIAAAESASSAASATLGAASARLGEASEAADAAGRVVQERSSGLGERETAIKEAEQEVRSVQAKQRELAREKEAYLNDKDRFKAVEDNILMVLVNGAWTSDKEAKKLSDNLIKSMKKYGTEPSLLASVPAVLLKKPEERRGFDEMVITSVHDIIKSRVAAMDAVLEANANTEREVEAELAQREQAVVAAQSARNEAAEQLAQAEAERAAKEEARRAAQGEEDAAKAREAEALATAEAARALGEQLREAAELLEGLVSRSLTAEEAEEPSKAPTAAEVGGA